MYMPDKGSWFGERMGLRGLMGLMGLMVDYDFFNTILKVVPLPSVELLTNILPLWYSLIIRFESDKPNPQPRCLLV
jgi:hypothetical protein